MGLCKKAIIVGASLTFYSSFAAALGLGEIKLNSALNQPLDAEISLLHVKELGEREIKVGLATPEDFDRTGVDRIYFLTDIKFKIDLNAEGGPVVKLTTTKPVREPFLDFIVSAQWPSGKLLREYTLLVDLPIFGDGNATAVAAPPKAEPQVKTIDRGRTEPEPVRPVSAPRVSTTVREEPFQNNSFDGQEYGPVGDNENLWNIAVQVRPDRSFTIQQTMLAIQSLNPEAFINNNINLLRRGQVLRIPDSNQISMLSRQEAISEVATQNRAWQGDDGVEELERPQLDGTTDAFTEEQEPEEVSGRIKLSTMDNTSEDGNGVATGDGADGDSAIESQLSVTQEELDAATRESDDLKSRMEAMDEQIATMEQLIQISSDELRALELAAEDTNLAEEGEPVTDSSAAMEDGSEAPVDATPLVEEPEVEVTDQEQVTPPPPAKKGGWLQMVKDNMLYIAGGAGVLIVLLAGLLFFRKRDDDFDDFDEDFEDMNQGFDEATLAMDDDGEEPTVVQMPKSQPQEEPTEEVISEAETDDVVGECDIHIAYGQYDQAEDKLIQALENDPRNIAVRMKLLEVLAARDDLDNFDAHYSVVRALGDADTLDRAEQLRSGFDGAEPFDDSHYDVTSFLSEINADYETSDTVIQQPPVNDNISSGFDSINQEDVSFDTDSEDDTLQFDLGETEVEGLDSEDEFVLHGEDDIDVTLEGEEDITLVGAHSKSEPEPEQEGEPTVARHRDDFESIENDLADLDFDLPEDDETSDAGELTLDEGFDSEFTTESDFEVESAESSSGDDELDADLDLDDLDTDFLTNDGAESAAEMEEPNLDFDLDKDLEDAMLSDEQAGASDSLDDLADNELEGLSSEPDINSALEEDVDLAGLTEPAPPLEEDDDLELSTEGSTDGSSDFDVDFDLDGDIDIEELDKELGELDLETKGDIELDGDALDDFDLDIEEEKAPEKTAQVVDIQSQKESSKSDNSSDFDIPDFNPEEDDDSGLEFLSDNDETATKLDLARAYIDMGDADGARDILDEIFEEGNDQQKKEAETLLAKLA